MSEVATTYETAPDAFALGIANAQGGLDSAAEQHQQVQAKERQIQSRIKALADERAAILKARERDTTDQDDEKHGQRLALITADMERLGELLEPAAEATRAAGQAVYAATVRLRQANIEHEQHAAGLAAQALEKRLRELEGLLMRGIGELASLKRTAAGGRDVLHGAQVFQPAAALTRFVVGGTIPSF